MYDELVKELRDSAEWADRLALLMGRAEGDAHAPSMRKAADAIEELQAQINGWIELERKALIKSVPKWISTAERQPEKSGLYLTYHAKRGSMTMHTMHYSANNEAWNAFDHEDRPKYALEVTHWMPLPEPPEVREND